MSTMDMGTRYSIWTSAHNAYVNGQYAKALKIYSTLQNLPQVLFNIASILIKMGKYNKAINYLSKAVTKEEVSIIMMTIRILQSLTFKEDFAFFLSRSMKQL
jgi:tetratricopeptide (TPR) repeat protein